MPRRDGDPHRDRVWRWVKRRWATVHPDWPLYEGHHDGGPFNRSAAVNTAARHAGDWDVAVIADSDLVIDAELVHDAVRAAADTGHLVIAFNVLAQLSASMTDQVLAGYDGSWQPGITTMLRDFSCGGLNAIARPLWDRLDGMDERFSGWGMEDVAFYRAAHTLSGASVRIEGVAWHLWHPPADHSEGGANPALLARYAAAAGDVDAMAAVLGERCGEFA